jgi:CRP-like cAMP-binding protein
MVPANRQYAVPSIQRPTGNRFLDTLTLSAMAELMPVLRRGDLAQGHVIYARDSVIDIVYFPLNSLLSVVLDMSDGSTAEVGVIGFEGLTGVGVALGHKTTQQRIVVQVPDGAYSCTGDEFAAAIERSPELKTAVLRFAQAVLNVSAHLSACNGLHNIDQRCARWLLMAHDRVTGDVVILTQELLSQMLGVRRAGVTVAASALQQAGLITYTRGHIKILDRRGLEAASCECYRAMERDWVATMGYGIAKGE